MEAIGETLENVGLAQEIQNGLAAGLQKEPAWADEAAVQAKCAALETGGEHALFQTSLGRYIMTEWALSAGMPAFPNQQAWEGFVKSAAFQLLAKYRALTDQVAAQSVTHKMFAETRPLGRGAFGVVFLTFKKDSGMALATKKIVKGAAKQNNMLKSVVVEQEVLAKTRGRFCVGLHYSYQDSVCIYLVLTLCPGGDLWFLLQTRSTDPKTGHPGGVYRKIGNDAVRFYTASMACGLQAIHDAGFVYRDLKPHNVLLDAEGQLRVSDMGLCVDISGGRFVSAENDPLGPSIKHGTCGYWPPEVIREQPYRTHPDWWALGVTAFQMWCDRLPFFGQNDDEKNEMILDAAQKLPERFTHDEPADLQKFVTDTLNVDMEARLGVQGGLAEVKRHEYFASFDWAALEAGTMPAPILPNINDINAPGKNEIPPFEKPKGVTWDESDQAHFERWEFFNSDLHGDEAICRIRKRKELVAALAKDGLKPVTIKGGGGGGCCSVS